jgi:O-antigen ligase
MRKIRKTQAAICVLLGLAILSHLLVAVNPDHTLPALPELFSIAIFSSIIIFTFSFKKELLLPNSLLRKSESITFGLIWFNVLFLIGFRAFGSIFNTPNQVWIPCKIAPGIATKVECFLQAAIIQHYGLRTFFMLITATLLGSLAFLIARKIRGGWSIILHLIIFSSFIVTATGLICTILGIEQVLPTTIMASVYSGMNVYRMTQIFGNSGWVWPYIAPGLAISFWLIVASSHWLKKSLYLLISLLIVTGTLATQQRGGLLLCLIYFITILICILINQIKKRRWFPLFLISFLTTISATYLFGQFQKLTYNTEISNSRLLNTSLFFDKERFQIWSIAFNFFKRKPLLGHGYASWFQLALQGGQENAEFAASGNLLDTAHNTIIQMLVEIGIIHTTFILLILGFIFYLVLQKIKFIPAGNLLLLLASISFFLPILVQEIDYIRPTFYIHTIFWGTLAGISNSNHKNHNFLHLKERVSLIHKINIFLFVSAIAGIVFCFINFSFGAFAFEAHLSQPSPVLLRWLNPNTSLVSFGTPENKYYSVYSTNFIQKPMKIQWQEGDRPISITAEDNTEFSIITQNSSSLIPQRRNFKFSESVANGTRWISSQIAYPPLQSNLSIPWSKNMYWWEVVEGKLGRWCGQDCWFLAQSCGIRDRVNFSVSAPGRDRTPDNPLSFDLAVYNLPQGSQFSSQTLENLPSPLTQDQYQLTQPEEAQQLSIEGKPDTALYLVHVETQSSFTPASGDRNLGVFIQEPDC